MNTSATGASGVGPSNQSNPSVAASGQTDVASVVDQYRDPSGSVDTRALAADIADTAQHDFQQADRAFQAVSSHLREHGSVFEAANFERDVQQRFEQTAAGGLWAPNHQARGAEMLRANPILEIHWESTTSAITGRAGFSEPLRQTLERGGVLVSDTVNPVPPGSLSRSDPGPTGAKNNHNGALARDAIADRYLQAGFETDVEVRYDTGTGRPTSVTASADAVGEVRIPDVQTRIPGARPEMDRVILTESKVGYTSNSGRAAIEAANDADLLSTNRSLRVGGSVLENVGKVARPVGLALDVYSVGAAYRADGNSFGENTQRTVSGIAGSAAGAWGGATAGAAIGTAIFPGVGTAVGGIVGGIVGGLAGDQAGKGIFDWFNG